MTEEEKKMRDFVKRLGIPLDVEHVPNPHSPRHAEIKDGIVLIYDTSEPECWNSLLHEIIEWRLRPVLKLYRDAINSLISLLEQCAYTEKEKALAEILNDFQVWRSQAPQISTKKRGRELINVTEKLH